MPDELTEWYEARPIRSDGRAGRLLFKYGVNCDMIEVRDGGHVYHFDLAAIKTRRQAELRQRIRIPGVKIEP